MTFGSDEFFEKLNNSISYKTPSDAGIFKELKDIIKLYKEKVIFDFVKDADATEDVLQDVYLAVFKGLMGFILDSKYKSPAQRETWLNNIVRNKSIDYLRKINNEEVVVNKDGTKEKRYTSKVSSLEDWITDDDNKERELPSDKPSAEKAYFDKFASDYLVKRLEHLFGLNVSLDRIIGYCYSKIIIPLESGNGFSKKGNGKPKEAVERLYGRNMKDLVRALRVDLVGAVNKEFPDELFARLEKKLDESPKNSNKKWKELSFELKQYSISEATTVIQKKVDSETERLEREKAKEEDATGEHDNEDPKNRR